jgi:hypothetical protein
MEVLKMSEKVLIPKEVSTAIQNLMSSGSGVEDILINVAQSVYTDDNLKILTEYIFDGTGLNGRYINLISALVNGYEIAKEETK